MKLRSTFGVAMLAMFGIAAGLGDLHAQDSGKERPLEFDLALGKLLFANVVRVHFTGPGHPANPDGSFGGLVADEIVGSIKIFEHYICRESAEVDGVTLREFHAYDKLGRFEQLRAANVSSAELNPKPAEDAQLILPPAPSRPHQEAAIDLLVEQFQKAKEAESIVVAFLSQQRFSGKVMGVSAERGIVHLKTQEGVDLFIAISKIEALGVPQSNRPGIP